MCIIDGEKLLRVVDFAIYSNRKLTVDALKSIFKLLWNERILNEQLKVKR
jgi:hypothetical protein